MIISTPCSNRVKDPLLPNIRKRFPFRGRVKPGLVDDVMKKVENMVHALVVRKFGKNSQNADIDDIRQRIMIFVWQKVLPKFDREANTKLSTFLYHCVQNELSDTARDILKAQSSKRRLAVCDCPSFEEFTHNRSHSLDKEIDRIAEFVMENPDEVLTPNQVRVFFAMIENPTVAIKDLAAILGYQSPRSLRRIVVQMHGQIHDAALKMSNNGYE